MLVLFVGLFVGLVCLVVLGLVIVFTLWNDFVGGFTLFGFWLFCCLVEFGGFAFIVYLFLLCVFYYEVVVLLVCGVGLF